MPPQPDIAIPTLTTILESLNDLKRQIGEQEEELQLVKTEDQKARVLKELAQLNARVDGPQPGFRTHCHRR